VNILYNVNIIETYGGYVKMNKEKVMSILKSKITVGVICFILGGIIFSNSPSEEMTKALDEQPKLQEEITTLSSKVTILEKDKNELQTKVTEAKPWFEMSEIEQAELQKKVEAEKKAKEAEEAKLKAEKEAEEKAKKEAEEKAKKEAEAKKYNTGITYKDLARNPTENLGKLVTFTGKIIQVMKGDSYTQYRMNINDDYDQTVLIEIQNDLLINGNILEDDTITIRGMFLMEQTYTTVLGAEKTIPSIIVNEVDY